MYIKCQTRCKKVLFGQTERFHQADGGKVHHAPKDIDAQIQEHQENGHTVDFIKDEIKKISNSMDIFTNNNNNNNTNVTKLHQSLSETEKSLTDTNSKLERTHASLQETQSSFRETLSSLEDMEDQFEAKDQRFI
ncbi:hypothetical protein SBOR_1873 [Sclerotinia borealis F-4128]|uniref:Uncharacterized protein n=1 Tax=Sclerotinia borealis (strain F-4128) TaxID=1432307 RepID=W9CNY2_SCLBF|nr:hypothetical protein SBOR_1873 [Sclerotinia borealis F-4128]